MTQDPLPIPDLDDDAKAAEIVVLAGLHKRYRELDARIAEMQEEQGAIKTRVRVLGPGKHDLGVGTVTVTPSKRFDADLAAEVLRAINPDLVATCSLSKVDAAITKRVVSGEVYERCQKQSGADTVRFS